MRSSVALSRDFIEAGVDKDAADVIAEAIVTHADESHATKADLKIGLAELKGELKADIAKLGIRISSLETQMKILVVLNIGIFISIIAILLRGTVGV